MAMTVERIIATRRNIFSGSKHPPELAIGAFVIPKYLQEQYPELDSVEDLKDDKYKALFATSETGGKGD